MSETPEPTTAPRDRRSFAEWRADHPRGETLAWVGLLVVATILRLWDLGDRPFHHDESQDAYFSWTFHNSFGSYEYNPLLHGPVRFYLTGIIYQLTEATDFTARLAPALMGVAVVVAPYLLRHQLGRVAAFAAGVMLAIGPSFLYFSRFAREDIYLAAITLAMIVAAFRFLERPQPLTLSLLAALVAISFGTKESGGVLTAIGALFFVVAAVVQGIRARRAGGSFGDGEIARAARAVGWPGLVYAVASFVIAYLIIFTQFFTNFECVTTATEQRPARETSCVNAIVYGLQYWSDQQEVARGSDAAWLYVSIIVGEEWPVLLLALVGTVFAVLRPTTLRLFLVWFFVGVFAFHAYGSERFAWLVIHPLLPLTLLAGLGVQCLWQLPRPALRRVALGAVAVGAAYLIVASFSANAVLRADPRSLLVSTQSSEQVKQVVDQIDDLGDVTITVDSSEGASFPYAWYFRDQQIGYLELGQLGAGGESTASLPPETQAAVLTEAAYERLRPDLAAYDCRRFDFRIWWVKEYSRAFPLAGKPPGVEDADFTPGAWWNWFTERKAWNPTGGMREWFCVRRDVGPLPGKGTESEIPPPAPA